MEKERKDQDWCDMYEYFKKEIMEYAESIKLPKFMVLRLRGLAEGKFMSNKKIKSMGQYDFKTILYTFKICKPEILSGFKANQTKFKDEKHKFNYALVIIESNINDVVIRLQNAQKAKEKTENVEVDNIVHEGANYKTKNSKINKNLNELW